MPSRAVKLVPFVTTSVVLVAGVASGQGAPPAVHLASSSGSVEVLAPEHHTPSVGEALAAGTRLATHGDGHAVITVEGRGSIALEPETTVVVQAPAERPHHGTPATDETSLVRGGVTVHVDAGATPVGIAVSQGSLLVQPGDATVRVIGPRESRVAVHDGRVRVRAGGREVIVREQSASRLETGRPASSPHALPGIPTWIAVPTGRLGNGSPVDVSGVFTAPTAGTAAQYHLVLTRDEATGAVISDRTVPATVTHFDGSGLGAGTYVARVSAIDPDGFEGPAAAAPAFTIAAPRFTPSSAGHRAQIEVPAGFFCGLDRGPMLAMHAPLQLSPGRSHTLRCATRADGRDAVDLPVTSSEAGGLVTDVRLDPPGYEAAGGMRVLQLQFRDAAGAAIIPDSVTVTGSAGVGVGTVHRTDMPGTYTATVHWGAGLPEVRLHITLNGTQTMDYRLAPDMGEGRLLGAATH